MASVLRRPGDRRSVGRGTLAHRLACLRVAEPAPGEPGPIGMRPSWPRRFVVEPPNKPAVTLAIEGLGANEVTLRIGGPHGAWQLRCGIGHAVSNPPVPRLLWGGRPESVVARAIWATPDTLDIWMRFDETVLCECLRLTFGAGHVSASLRGNLWPDITDCATRVVY